MISAVLNPPLHHTQACPRERQYAAMTPDPILLFYLTLS
jgi:hypothetical protein